ncbi:glycosyltransferase [Vibrio metschnikovii]|nr:glycosyltransferase [Vibrio metschnikovii]
MRFSIITTFYNAESTIKDTIESIKAQKFSDYEYILIDGLSTDSSLDIAIKETEGMSNIKIISEKDKGIYDGMNKGIKIAEGEIIAILNADDYFEPEALSVIDDHFRNHSCDILAATTRKVSTDKTTLIEPLRSSLKKLSPSNPAIHHPSLFVKRSVYESVGDFSLKYKISADFDFISRAINADVVVSYVDDITTNMRIGGVSDTIRFHTTKNLEHLSIGNKNIKSKAEKYRFYLYVFKKYIYGILKYSGLVK